MKLIVQAIFLSFAAVVAGCGGSSGEDLSLLETAEARRATPGLRRSAETTTQIIEEAQRSLGDLPNSGDSEATRRLFKSVLNELAQKQQQLDVQIDIQERSWESLRVEKTELQRQKERLEQDQKYLSAGFLTTFIAACAAIFALILRLPTLWLDRELKKLEVEERRIALGERRKGLASTAVQGSRIEGDAHTDKEG